MAIRNSAKALIINDNKVLLIKNQNTLDDIAHDLLAGTIYYTLPGGGQNQYETLEETVKRECLEETGYTVEVDRLAVICEEIWMNDKFRQEHENYTHKIYFIFICRLADKPMEEANEKDFDMIGTEWVDINKVKDIRLISSIKSNLEVILNSNSIVYLEAERIY